MCVGSDNNILSIEYELYPTSTGVCITCTFLDSFATDCVAVVHQQISQLSCSGLLNIESSHKFNRSGDTAYGCIEGVDLEQYQVGVMRSASKSTALDVKGIQLEGSIILYYIHYQLSGIITLHVVCYWPHR